MTASLAIVCLLLGQGGKELTAEGEALLGEGRYAEALRVFRRAAELSPRSAMAFYNQALAMAGLRRSAKPAGPRPSPKSVLDVAEVALKLDPGLKSRAEADLPSVRKTFRGQRLLGRTPKNGAAAILQAITWRSRANERLEFAPDGTVRLCRCYDFEAAPPAGQWKVEKNRVFVTVGATTHEGELGEDGVLSLGRLGRFFDW